MRPVTAVQRGLLPCIQFQRLQSQELWLVSVQFPSGYEAVLGWVLCHLELRVPQAMKGSPTMLSIWKRENPSEVYTENNQASLTLKWDSEDYWSANFCRSLSRLKVNQSNAKKLSDMIKKVLTHHVIISTRNCMMELRTGNWIGVTVMHPRTFTNGGSINIFHMTEIQHLLSAHHILFLPILVPFKLAIFLLNNSDLMDHHILTLLWRRDYSSELLLDCIRGQL